MLSIRCYVISIPVTEPSNVAVFVHLVVDPSCLDCLRVTEIVRIAVRALVDHADV